MAPTSPSGKPATIQDVADHAGVSMATVSRVLSGNYPVAPATRAKVHKAVSDLDYVANAHARALAGTASKLVAILVSDLTAPFYSAIAYGVEQQAVAEDRLCMVATTGGDPEREVAMVEALRRQSADAVVLIGGVVDTPEYQDRMSRLAGLLDSAGSRLVLCGRPSLGTKLPVTVVEYDNEGGAFAVTSHLLSLGHRRILFLGGLDGNTTTVARLAGFRKALAAFGVAETVPPVMGSMGRLFGYEAMTGVLEQRAGSDLGFTAVVAAEDLVAGGAMSALREAGLRVPDDVSVTGFNDDYMAPDLVASLTTVHIPAEELGRAAVRLALHRDDTPPPTQHMKLGTHIVVRDSVRPLIGG